MSSCFSVARFIQKSASVDSKRWPRKILFLPPANEVCEGYVFTGVCLSTGGGVCGCSQGGMRGCWGLRGCSRGGHAWLLRGRGACVVAPGGACVDALGGGMCGCSWGAGGACMVAPGGHAWLLWGACVVAPRGAWLLWGGCMVALGACVGYDEIRRYGQWAGGTHPTGMHSCWWFFSQKLTR